MKTFRIKTLLIGLLALAAMTVAAQAAPPVIFNACAYWATPFCFMMKATDGRTYQLLDAGPALTPGVRALVYANKGGEFSLCFAPTAKVVRFRMQPLRPC